MITILIAVAAATFVFYAYLNSEFRRRRLLLKKFPHPKQDLIMGNAKEFGEPEEFLTRCMELMKKYGKTFYFRLGPFVDNLYTSDPKLFEFYLGSSKLIEKSRSYDFFHRWLGLGLFNAKGSRWKQQRKILTPTFHFKILEEYVEVFNSVGNVLLKCLEKEIGKDSFDVYRHMILFTLDVICETVMGVPINAQINSESAYVNSVKEINKIIHWRDITVIGNFDLTYRFTENYRKELKCVEVLHNFTDSVIKQRKEQLEKKDMKEESNEFGIKKRMNFLDLMLQSKDADGNRPLSDEDIRQEVDTFMFGGHDTTAGVMSFALYCLANDPEVQSNLVKELNEIFQDDPSRVATFNDLQEMKYLKSVIKETMRLYPTAPFVARCPTEDIEYDGKIIPKGTNVQFLIYNIQRDEDNFPNPLKFDPSRFMTNEKINPYVFVPFSAGPRNCIGQKFAMLEMKATLSKVLRKYELLPAIPNPEPILVAENVLISKNGNNIRIKLRK